MYAQRHGLPQHPPSHNKHQPSGSSAASVAAAASMLAATAKAQHINQSMQNVAAHLRVLDPTFDHRAVASVLSKVRDSMISGAIEDEDDALARAVELITQHIPPAINVGPAAPSVPSGLSKEEQEAVETERRDMDLATEMALTSAADEKAKRSKDERKELLAADLMDVGKLRETGLVDCVVLGGLRKVASFDFLCKATVGLAESTAVGTEAKAKIQLVSLCQLTAKCRKWWGTDAVPYIKEMAEQVPVHPSLFRQHARRIRNLVRRAVRGRSIRSHRRLFTLGTLSQPCRPSEPVCQRILRCKTTSRWRVEGMAEAGHRVTS